jgi:hypothetical protein
VLAGLAELAELGALRAFWRDVVELDEVDFFAAAVLGDFEKIEDSEEA